MTAGPRYLCGRCGRVHGGWEPCRTGQRLDSEAVASAPGAGAGADRSAPRRDTFDGPQKFCAKCAEWWPADGEFFWLTKGRWHYCSKACYLENDRRPGRRPAVAPVRALDLSQRSIFTIAARPDPTP